MIIYQDLYEYRTHTSQRDEHSYNNIDNDFF